MGMPKDLKPAQLEELSRLTRDLPETDRVIQIGKGGIYKLRSNDVVLITWEKTTSSVDGHH
jgi:hypothetical protein